MLSLHHQLRIMGILSTHHDKSAALVCNTPSTGEVTCLNQLGKVSLHLLNQSAIPEIPGTRLLHNHQLMTGLNNSSNSQDCNCAFQKHAESEIQITTNSCIFCCCQLQFKYLFISNQQTMKNRNQYRNLQKQQKSNCWIKIHQSQQRS